MSAFVGFICVFLLGLASGVSFSHLLQRGPKRDLPPAEFVAVQRVLLRDCGAAIGALEVAALLSTLASAVIMRGQPVASMLAGIAAACVLVMLIIWAAWIKPINRTVNSWTIESFPSNWMDFRERWHLLHLGRLVFSLIAFGAAIGVLIA